MALVVISHENNLQLRGCRQNGPHRKKRKEDSNGNNYKAKGRDVELFFFFLVLYIRERASFFPLCLCFINTHSASLLQSFPSKPSLSPSFFLHFFSESVSLSSSPETFLSLSLYLFVWDTISNNCDFVLAFSEECGFFMATAPVKSQPLHNFSLPFLKWGGKNHTNTNHRFRRPVSGESSSSHAFAADHNSEVEVDPETRAPRVGSRTARNRFGLSPCYLGEKSQKQEQQPQPLERVGNNETDDEVGGIKRENVEPEDAEADGTAQKPWNLRPRKSIFSRGTVEIGVGALRNGEFPENASFSATVHSAQQNENPPQPKSLRLRGFAENQNTERKEKRKFWIALSKDEIEEDIFVMTGSRPARRPKKRPKNVQKQLDSVFPGLWLVGYTADVYKAADTTAKK